MRHVLCQFVRRTSWNFELILIFFIHNIKKMASPSQQCQQAQSQSQSTPTYVYFNGGTYNNVNYFFGVYRETRKCLISIDGKTRIKKDDSIPFLSLQNDNRINFEIGETYYLDKGRRPAIYYGVLYSPFRLIFQDSNNIVISIPSKDSKSIASEPKPKSLCIIL